MRSMARKFNMASRNEVLQLFRQLLREGQKFTSYNYRMYAVRRVKDAFREHKDVQDTERQRTLIQTAQNNLEVMKRQVIISNMYQHNKLVIEKK